MAPDVASQANPFFGVVLHSIGGLAARIAGRAAGNPFFAEEIVRDLAERNVIDGRRGD